MASAKCISSIVVRTPSFQLGVLQSLQGSFQLVRSHLLTSLVHTSGGIQSEAATSPLSTKVAQVGHKGVNPFTILQWWLGSTWAQCWQRGGSSPEITEASTDKCLNLALQSAQKQGSVVEGPKNMCSPLMYQAEQFEGASGSNGSCKPNASYPCQASSSTKPRENKKVEILKHQILWWPGQRAQSQKMNWLHIQCLQQPQQWQWRCLQCLWHKKHLGSSLHSQQLQQLWKHCHTCP